MGLLSTKSPVAPFGLWSYLFSPLRLASGGGLFHDPPWGTVWSKENILDPEAPSLGRACIGR
jgi:hypothetical protein